jgi:Acetyltransferase (GNAT) domain
MRLVAEGAEARPVWERVLAADPTATISQTPAWLDCLCAVGPWTDATRAYAMDDGRELVLPLVRRRGSPHALPVEGSMPFGWGNGGLLCGDGELSATDVATVVADLSRRRPVRMSLRPGPAREESWSRGMPGSAGRAPRFSQTVDLAGGFAEVTARFSRSTRRNIRRAEDGPLTVDWQEGGRLMPVFDRLYRISVDRWAERQHEPRALARWRARRRDSRTKFETVAERLGAACRIGVAWLAGEPAAAIVVLSHEQHGTYWRGAMDQAVAANTRASELLHSLAIEDACLAGRRWYHMGDSAPSSSLAEFKRRFGAGDEHHTVYLIERWPLTATEQLARRAVKRALRFRD